ncbi:hypothetical protein QP028_01490 [Corynebacterium suedekumii]|nr:hypothetical protein QP028_01490 [Corynebacterium suedekumii]
MATDIDNRPVTDGLGSDPKAVEANVGPAGHILINTLDRAVSIQSSAIVRYVEFLREKNPDAGPAEIQEIIDKHFMRLSTGSGAGAGAAAAIPGIGFFTGAAAIGAESLVFLDAAAWYTMASAQLRGVDITEKERRKALILLALLGSEGYRDRRYAHARPGVREGLPSASTLARFSAPKLGEVNNHLMRTALKQVTKKFRRAWLGKIMPLGIGAILGTVANRKLAKNVITNSRESLGPVPASFAAGA